MQCLIICLIPEIFCKMVKIMYQTKKNMVLTKINEVQYRPIFEKLKKRLLITFYFNNFIFIHLKKSNF